MFKAAQKTYPRAMESEEGLRKRTQELERELAHQKWPNDMDCATE